MPTKQKRKLSLKKFLLKKSTLIGWSIILLVSIPMFSIIFRWSLLQSLFFVTLKGLFAGSATDTESTILHFISLFYFIANFLVYTFNLYPVIRKILLEVYSEE